MNLEDSKIGSEKLTDVVQYKQLAFKYQLIKGRIAENLIQELFLSEGYQVFKYGVENNYPYLLQQIKRNETGASLSLRYAPDLVVYHPVLDKIHYAEVKFCSNGKFELNPKINLDQYKQAYPNCFFFIISSGKFYSIPFDVLCKETPINLKKSMDYELGTNDEFKLRPKSIVKFEEMSEVLLNKKLPSKY